MLLFSSMQMRRTSICWHLQLRTRRFVGAVSEKMLDNLFYISVLFDVVGWEAGRASGLQKTEWWGAGMVICLERGAHLHMAQLMPLSLIVSCFSEIQIGFTFLVLAHPGNPGQRAIKWVCVCTLAPAGKYG